MEDERHGLGNKIRLWLSTDLTLLLFHSTGSRSFYRGCSMTRPSLLLTPMQASLEHNTVKLFVPKMQHVASGQRDSRGVTSTSCPQT